MTRDELEQQLWELEYGLISEEDAAALRAQIASDPEVAQLQQRVRANSLLVAQAAKIDAPRIKLRIPRSEEDAVAVSASAARSSTSGYSVRIRRVANWSLSIATSLLIGLFVWTALPSTRPGREIAEFQQADATVPIVIKVDTPARLSREVNNPISISTWRTDGKPQSTELQMKLEDKLGRAYFFDGIKTDEKGRANVQLPSQPATDAYTLNIARANESAPSLQVDFLAADELQFVTHLGTDKPRYRPGETVRYRSVTLSRFGLKADRDVAVEFVTTDPAGQELADSKLTGTTQHGVGNGDFSLKSDATRGQYTLIARSPDRIFPEVRRDFVVLTPAPRQYDFDVEWGANGFAAGAQAEGEITVRTPDGQPAADVKLSLRGFVDGQQVKLAQTEVPTDSAGKATVNLTLPSQIASSEGELAIEAGDQAATWKDIPLQADQVQVEFYPEGGDLVAGLENRVYFHAHDFADRPIAIRGRILDSEQREVATAATQVEGRGAFRFTPQAGATFSLAIDDPPAIKSQPALPPVPEQSRLVLDAGTGIFDGDEPIRVKLRSVSPPAEFGVVAYCRGVTVGQLTGTAADFAQSTYDVSVPVIADAAGVVRVTVFDYSKQPPEPIAERLVFRRPHRKLNVQVAGLLPNYSAGQVVSGQIVTTDETGAPVPTVLGLSVLDDSVLQLADRQPPGLATQFLLLGDVNRPDKLEDANLYLSEDEASAIALDLLLATQGWRRFDRVPVSQLAQGIRTANDGLTYRVAGADDTFSKKNLGNKSDVVAQLYAQGINQLSETVEDAPRRFDNRATVGANCHKTTANTGCNHTPTVTPICQFRRCRIGNHDHRVRGYSLASNEKNGDGKCDGGRWNHCSFINRTMAFGWRSPSRVSNATQRDCHR
jgi:5-hydroxyisourate hydrolase-like protein (transthyretin family)